jgi:copper chaperone
MTTESSYLVRGLSCGGCVGTLTRKAMAIYGVVHVDVDLRPGDESTVVIRHADSVSADRIASALAEAGYSVGALAAS